MPIIKYGCNNCGEESEELFLSQKERENYEKNNPECPHCDEKGLKALISKTHFELKGGGWYEDGYASKRN